MTEREGVYVSDAKGEVLPRVRSIAEERRRHHPELEVTDSGTARDLLWYAVRDPAIIEKVTQYRR